MRLRDDGAGATGAHETVSGGTGLSLSIARIRRKIAR
jgi:hypothetical protein